MSSVNTSMETNPHVLFLIIIYNCNLMGTFTLCVPDLRLCPSLINNKFNKSDLPIDIFVQVKFYPKN